MAKKAARGSDSPATIPMVTKKAKGRGVERDQFLKGMEPITITELEAAAERYEDLKVRRMELGEEEAEAKEELQGLMEKHAKAKTPGITKSVDGFPRYHAQGIHRIVEIESAGLTLKVKKEPKPPKAE